MSKLNNWLSHSAVSVLLAVSLLTAHSATAAVLAGWDVHSLAGGSASFGASPLSATTADANLTVVGLTRGSGISTSGTAAARGWGGTDWQTANAAAAVTGNDVVTFSVTANSGYQVSLSAISKLDYRRSSTGPSSGVLQYKLGNGAYTDITTLSFTATASSGGSISSIDLSSIPALQNVAAGTTVSFRIANYGGSSSTGTWYIYDVANTTADDLQISGTVSVGSGVVNGSCGSSNGQTLGSIPSSNLCSLGSASAVTGTGPWNWSCSGTGGGSTASCSANLSAASPFTIFHTNDVHARLTPHKWVIPAHGSAAEVFEDVGGAAHLAGKMLSLVAGKPTALVLDGGDISEGNPVGDMNCTTPTGGGTPVCSNSGYGNGGMTAFYTLLHQKLAALGGSRGSRGIDALVVGNHDVRDISYITNMEAMHTAGVPIISLNVRDIATHAPHFAPWTTVTVNGTKVGIIGYTTSTATVGASLANTLEVVDCQWSGSTTCNISDYVTELRNNQHCDVVILLTHDGHSDLVDPAGPVLADTGSPKVPEIAVTGHWHTWAETAWQPQALNYKSTFVESSSYMKYIGELNVDGTGKYLSATQHVLRNSDITPDADVAAFVSNLIAQYNAAHPGHPVDEVVGYTSDALLLDNAMKWWSPDEYPWNGNNTAGQWITDAMKWKCDRISWPSAGGCDLAVEAGGGVRADIPAGPVTYLQVYETFPWADDTYVRINMTGQDIINFLKATNLGAGFSRELTVTATDGVLNSVLMNGQPIGLSTTYKVAINNYMLAHPPSGYVWPTNVSAESDPANELVRDSLSEFMRVAHNSPATAYTIGGSRYTFNGEYSGGYRAVVTMMNDAESKPTFEDAFVRLLGATTETLARRGSHQVPADLVNADGSVNGAHRLAEQELYRSFLGFKTGLVVPGDILEVWGKASFYGGNPEFVDQEGIYGDGLEFKIIGHDAAMAKPTYVASLDALLTNAYKNHYVRFLARKTAADTVVDQNGKSLKIWDQTGYTAATLPGAVGDTLDISGVLTMESFGYRLRRGSAAVTSASLPAALGVSSHVLAQAATASAPITVTATASISGGGYALVPVADAQVASGASSTNYGSGSNLYLQGSTASGTFGIERAWLKFDLSSIPAGSTITGASLQLFNWKATGPSISAEARGISTDTWTETGLNWSNQPATGTVLDTQTLASGTTSVWYNWNVTSFVQSEFAGDKTVSLLVKASDEALAGGPTYGFDAKEYGSNVPVLQVTTQATASSVANVKLYYRYSANNTTWGSWTQIGSDLSAAPYSAGFSFPNGLGYYEFYSVATDNLGNIESTPLAAQSAVVYQSASGSAQTISFAALSDAPAGSSASLIATASSSLPVSFSSQTPGICSVSGAQVTSLTIGTCVLAANQSGNVSYWLPAAAVTRSFSVTGVPQSISFTALIDASTGGTQSLIASATSGLTVSFSSQTPSICSVSGTSVSAQAGGTCTVAANQAGDGGYWLAAATVTRSFTVAGQAQTITFAALTDKTLGVAPFGINAAASSGLTVTFASLTSSVCTSSGGTVTLLKAGTCTIQASQAGNANYNAAPSVSRSFAVFDSGAAQGDSSGNGDAPLPLWALVLMAAGLMGMLQIKQRSWV